VTRAEALTAAERQRWGAFASRFLPEQIVYSLTAVESILAARLDAALTTDGRADLADRIAAVEAVLARVSRPLDGARQRANTNEDFATIAAEESVRRYVVGEIRAALGDPAATLTAVKAAASEAGR